MYCPKCLTEYRDGFFQCADCGVTLAPGLPEPPLSLPPARNSLGTRNRGDIDLVTVLETNDPFALSLATAALEDAGIEYLAEGGIPKFDVGSPYTFGVGLSGFQKNFGQIQVAAEFAADARALVERFEEPLSPDEIDRDAATDSRPRD
jgi:hypothetical protein